MPHLLTYQQTAKALGFRSTKSVQRLIKHGILQPVAPIPGGRPRIHSAQLDDYIERLNPLSQLPDYLPGAEASQQALLKLMKGV